MDKLINGNGVFDFFTPFIAIGFLIGIFLLFRQVNLWYFKINESIELKKESIRLLELISEKLDRVNSKEDHKS